MADTFPSTFVDTKTGEITKFQTFMEKVKGEYLPETGHVGILGVKLAMLAPFVGGPLVAVGAAALVFGVTRAVVIKAVDMVHEKLLLRHKQGDFIEFDFSQQKDRDAFQKKFGATHPNFIDEYMHLTKAAKLEQVPKVFVIDQFFKKEGRTALGGLVSDYMAGTTSRPSGKDPVIMLGKGALKDLNEGELRAVVAHEMTHLALGHPKKGVRWMARMPLNGVINIALVGAALFGPLPFLPVLGVVVGSNVLGRALKSIKSRHQEEMCDRGAALMTGGTDDLSDALGKIRKAMVRMKSVETEYTYRSQGLDPPEPQEAGKLKQFIDGSHPSNERRNKLLDRFEDKHGGYAEKKRNFFAATFNKAAKRFAPHVDKLVSGVVKSFSGFSPA
jgi:Zn-dependent protease with chaperone function